MNLTTEAKQELETALSRKNLRNTRQRELIYSVLHGNTNHPTADDVFSLVKDERSISLATVYNCLETFVDCGLIKEVNMGRNPTRYDPDHSEHGHFFCGDCGEVFDIKLSDKFLEELKNILPEGFKAESVQLNFKGVADCDEDPTQCEELAADVNLSNKTLR